MDKIEFNSISKITLRGESYHIQSLSYTILLPVVWVVSSCAIVKACLFKMSCQRDQNNIRLLFTQYKQFITVSIIYIVMQYIVRLLSNSTCQEQIEISQYSIQDGFITLWLTILSSSGIKNCGMFFLTVKWAMWGGRLGNMEKFGSCCKIN